jgi:hypothetical protein
MLSSFVQGSAEQAVCNNALSALTVLQGYRSPHALDAAGFPQPPTASTNTVNNNSSSNTAPQQQQQQREVYKYRLPFRQLRAQPLQLLRAQVTASTVASLVPLVRPLGLEASALYALLVETLYSCAATATASTATSSQQQQQQQQQQLPPFAEVQQWLQAVKSPAVACRTAQWVAQQCLLNSSNTSSSSSSSRSSSSAIDSAIAALEHAVAQAKLAVAQGATALPLLPVRIAAQLQPTATAKQVTATVTVVEEQQLAADKVYKVLKHERMELRHHRVVLQHLDARYAAELSQFYGSR